MTASIAPPPASPASFFSRTTWRQGGGPAAEEKSADVVLARVPSPLEAELLRGRLAAEGIAAELYDVHTASIGLPFANALGGVTVVVSEHDELRARDVLAGRGVSSTSIDDEGEESEEGYTPLPHSLAPSRRPAPLSGALVTGCVGAVCCPPLGVYSLWLLWRSLRRSAAWSVRLRCEAALVLGVDLWASFELLRFFVP